MLWLLALNITAIILICAILINDKHIYSFLFGIILLYANVVCMLINIKIIVGI